MRSILLGEKTLEERWWHARASEVDTMGVQMMHARASEVDTMGVQMMRMFWRSMEYTGSTCRHYFFWALL
jgi:hypothetical protein